MNRLKNNLRQKYDGFIQFGQQYKIKCLAKDQKELCRDIMNFRIIEVNQPFVKLSKVFRSELQKYAMSAIVKGGRRQKLHILWKHNVTGKNQKDVKKIYYDLSKKFKLLDLFSRKFSNNFKKKYRQVFEQRVQQTLNSVNANLKNKHSVEICGFKVVLYNLAVKDFVWTQLKQQLYKRLLDQKAVQVTITNKGQTEAEQLLFAKHDQLGKQARALNLSSDKLFSIQIMSQLENRHLVDQLSERLSQLCISKSGSSQLKYDLVMLAENEESPLVRAIEVVAGIFEKQAKLKSEDQPLLFNARFMESRRSGEVREDLQRHLPSNQEFSTIQHAAVTVDNDSVLNVFERAVRERPQRHQPEKEVRAPKEEMPRPVQRPMKLQKQKRFEKLPSSNQKHVMNMLEAGGLDFSMCSQLQIYQLRDKEGRSESASKELWAVTEKIAWILNTKVGSAVNDHELIQLVPLDKLRGEWKDLLVVRKDREEILPLFYIQPK